jgi:MFS family permease
VLILTAAFMVVLDFSIVNVALASIETELGFPADAVQWIITAYAIAFGGLLILGGRAADLFGRRRMFIAGQVLGGVLVQFTSWRAVFLVNVPVGVLAVALAPWLLAESRQRKPGARLDGAGALLITIAVAGAVFAMSQVDVLGWTSPVLLAVTALAVVAAAGSSPWSGTTPTHSSGRTCCAGPDCARPAR